MFILLVISQLLSYRVLPRTCVAIVVSWNLFLQSEAGHLETLVASSVANVRLENACPRARLIIGGGCSCRIHDVGHGPSPCRLSFSLWWCNGGPTIKTAIPSWNQSPSCNRWANCNAWPRPTLYQVLWTILAWRTRSWLPREKSSTQSVDRVELESVIMRKHGVFVEFECDYEKACICGVWMCDYDQAWIFVEFECCDYGKAWRMWLVPERLGMCQSCAMKQYVLHGLRSKHVGCMILAAAKLPALLYVRSWHHITLKSPLPNENSLLYGHRGGLKLTARMSWGFPEDSFLGIQLHFF